MVPLVQLKIQSCGSAEMNLCARTVVYIILDEGVQGQCRIQETNCSLPKQPMAVEKMTSSVLDRHFHKTLAWFSLNSGFLRIFLGWSYLLLEGAKPHLAITNLKAIEVLSSLELFYFISTFP